MRASVSRICASSSSIEYSNRTNNEKEGTEMTNFRLAFAAAALLLGATGAQAQDTYKIGMSAGLTGYAATVDRAWRDGVEIAIAALNAKGGILGKKVELVVEDNKSEPQEA